MFSERSSERSDVKLARAATKVVNRYSGGGLERERDGALT